MKNLKNIVFAALLVFLFVEVLIIFPRHLEHKEDPTATDAKATADAGQPQQKMTGIHLVEAQQGHRDWEIFATAAEGTQGTAAWELQKVRALFYIKDKVGFTVTGDQGTIDGKSKDLRIKGNVVTSSENGYTFKTPSIAYSAKTRTIRSPEQLSMTGPKDQMGEGFVITGNDMVVLVDQSKMIINANVKGSKKFNDGKAFQIRSEKAEFSGKSHQASFTGGVEMKYGELQLHGPAAVFQYKGTTSTISAIEIEGGVKVVDADKVATAQTVNLDLLKNIFTFRGKPKVVQNNDEIAGEEIVFLEGGKKVRVKQAEQPSPTHGTDSKQ
jgi:LPS export ABC transporter protein LptC/lipopolysaccharide transport protein LptA